MTKSIGVYARMDLEGKITTIDILNEENLDRELEKGYRDMLEGRIKSVDKVFEEIRSDHNI